MAASQAGQARPAAQTVPPGTQRRADARRNIASIIDAAISCLAHDPDASVGDIARAAGVGRVTLYGHFNGRAELIDAVLTRTLAEADATLDAVDTTGDPREALTRLVGASWRIVHQFRSVLHAAQRELPPERIRAPVPPRRAPAVVGHHDVQPDARRGRRLCCRAAESRRRGPGHRRDVARGIDPTRRHRSSGGYQPIMT